MIDKLKEFIKRAEGWPPEAQKEAADALLDIEEEFVIGPETAKEVEEARAQARRGEGISLGKMKDHLGL
jgi:hypothetical protein